MEVSWHRGVKYSWMASHPEGHVTCSAIAIAAMNLPAARATSQLAHTTAHIYCMVFTCWDQQTLGRVDHNNWTLHDDNIVKEHTEHWKDSWTTKSWERWYAKGVAANIEGKRWGPDPQCEPYEALTVRFGEKSWSLSVNTKSQELREGGGTGRVMWHGGSGGNLGAVGLWNGMKGTKQDNLVWEYEGQWSYEAGWSLMDKARWKYDVRGVYKANQTNAFC